MRYLYFIGVLLLSNGALHFGPIGCAVAVVLWVAYGCAYWRKAQ